MSLLVADRITFAYDDRPVLREISLKLEPGEIISLIGPNGSGKSTLLRVLLGQLRGSGAIGWDEKPLRNWRRRDLARRVAYLPQTATWDIEHRVIDVLTLGRTPYWGAFGLESARDAEIVESVAAKLSLTDLLNRRIDELSGGQRQRVFLGRCLVQEPGAMLLDEPNTYLDIRHEVEMLQTLRTLARADGVAILMASHDLNLAAALADRLILLAEGRIAAEGNPRDVLRPEILSGAYGVAMKRLDDNSGGPPMVFPVIP